VIVAGQMEATGESGSESGFEQRVRVLEAQRKVQRMGKNLHQAGDEHEQEERGKQDGFGPSFPDL
jgi:hypothetical protein